MSCRPMFCVINTTTICDQCCSQCPVRAGAQHSSVKRVEADYFRTMSNIEDAADLGVKYINFTGGNPLLLPWLIDALELSRHRKLSSSLSMSGKSIVRRLDDWSGQHISRPDLVLFSLDGTEDYHDKNRGVIGSHEATLIGISVASEVRSAERTSIVFTLIPGAKGNMNQSQFEFMVGLAEKSGIPIDVNPVWGLSRAGSKEEIVRNWTNLNSSQEKTLNWLLDQEVVLQESLWKVEFARKGGNDITDPICQAGKAIVTITASGQIGSPCVHEPNLFLPISKGGLKAAWASEELQEAQEKSGKMEGKCENCMIWCNLIPSLLFSQDQSTWDAGLLGI